MQKGKVWVVLLATLIACSMVIPSWVLVADYRVDQVSVSTIDGEYYTILYSDAGDKAAFQNMNGIQVVKSDEWGAVIKAPKTIAGILENKYTISEIPGRTNVRLAEQGVEFDSKTGYDVPQGWRVDSSSLYLVQFVAPFDSEWRQELNAHSSAFFSMIGDNLAVVKLAPAEKAAVSALPFVEWVGIYQPYFKVYENAREQTGTFRVKASPVGVTIEQLSSELIALGAYDVLLNDGCGLVEATITDAMLPSIASLESVGLVQYAPEMVQQGGLSSEMVGAYKVWNMNLSHLPKGIRGQGQVYQHQDLGFDETHYDFAMGPLGNRVLYTDGATDDNSHSTGCIGIAAGNGYDMEGWLGLSNTNWDYAEFAATNPIGFIDRAGFAGRAPEASIVAYDGLVTSEWDNGYTAQGARIFSNSFGPGSVTNGYVNDADAFMASYPQGLVFFSACNYGPNEMTVTGVGNGKMVVSVGAAENNRPDWFDTSDNPYSLWTGSCKGPVAAADLRVKPDVIEYGAGMIMPKSDGSDSGMDDDIYRGSNNDDTLGIDYDPDARMDYYKNQGTSFSCPAAAGDAVLIRDYLQDVVGMATPDPMAIKAYLIEGARDMGYGLPSYGQGWGMCNVEYSICPPAPTTNKYFTGVATTSNSVYVNSSAAPLKVTMCQWDSDTTSGALTTDYDLVITAPNGTRYEGNAFREGKSISISAPASWANCAFPSWSARPSAYPTGAYDWDTANDGGDDINTVEVVLIDSPQKGNWTINVTAKSGAGPSWHVVAAADFGPAKAYDLDVKQDVPVTWHVRNGYGTASFQAPAGQTVAVGFSVLNFGLNADTISLAASYQGDGSTAGSPLPSGWSVAYDTGAALSLQSNELKHVIARVTSPTSATEGAYPIRVLATSGGNSTIKDYYVFNIDIVNRRLPNRVRVTNDNYSLADMTPGVAAYNASGTQYVVVAYVRDMGLGNRAFVSVSSDGGASFGPQIQVTTVADDPNYLELKCAPAGHDRAGRMFISYNGMNPLVNGDVWDEVTERRAVICYADPPYTSWSVVVPFANGQGSLSNCDFRENDIGFWVNPAGPDEVHFMVIEYQYASNSMGSNIDDMAPVEKVSTDGGVTWPTTREIYVDSGTYQFSLGCNNDNAGDLYLTFYMIATTRVMFAQRYTGTWGTAVQAMNLNPDAAQWGYSDGDPTQHRYYVVGGRAAQSNYNDWKRPTVTYSDNDGTSWSTPMTLGGTGNICDNGHFDGNNLMDVDVTGDGYAWVTAKQVPQNTANKYWSHNLYTGSSNNGFSTYTESYPTRDSFAKEPAFRSTRQGNNLLLAYNSVETGHSDIFLLKMYNGWAADTTDTLGPITRFVHVPDIWQSGVSLSILATVDDIASGNHTISAAQYRWDGGSATAMSADDGTFNGVMESVGAVYSGSLTAGLHYVEVRAQDSIGNWGSWTGKWVNFYDVTLPDAPVFAGLDSVVNPGTGTSLRLTWVAATDYHSEYPITYYIYRSTVSGFDPNSTAPISTWAPVTSPGTPLTWNDTTVVAGTTYYYIVRAEDAGGTLPNTSPLRELNFIERSGTPESLVWFQVQSPLAGYRNLNTDSLEGSIQTSTTNLLTAPGNYQIDDTTNNKWRSDVFASATSLDGLWKFYVYGKMNNANANGTLYAKVYRYSDSLPLFTTGLDDENIASFTAAYHQFAWTYTASGITIPASDRYYVELWLNVTGATTAPGGSALYDYKTGVATNKWASQLDSDNTPPTTITVETAFVNPGDYTNVATSEDTRMQSIDPGSGDYVSLKFWMWLNETAADIESMDLSWEGYVTRVQTGAEVGLYAWNRGTSSWTLVGSQAEVGTTPDTTVTATLSGVSWSDYIGTNNNFTWAVCYLVADGTGASNTRLQTDYVSLTVHKVAIPGGQFTFAYDNDAAPSAIHVPGPTSAYTPWLNISVVAGWNLISIPYVGPTALPGALLDKVNGGTGLVVWDRVQIYTPATPADRWKQYNTGWAAALNDLAAVDNKMGVWIYVTTVGDGQICLGGAGYSNATSTITPISVGWNLIGFPSDDTTYAVSQLKADTLATITVVEGFDAGQTYRTIGLADGAFLQAGRAYWVYSTSATNWTKAW